MINQPLPPLRNLFLASTLLFFGIQASAQQSVDRIFIGDNIITMDGSTVRAVAVSGDRISATGSEAEIRALAGADTRIVELGQQALIPGFIDAHGHFSGVARNADLLDLSSPPVGAVNNIEDIIRMLRNRIEVDQIPEGEWVYGFGYDDSLLEENRHPTAADLDQASERHPIVLRHVSGHLIASNSAALEAAGVSSLTENPPGGVIRRLAGSNEPNGVMEETAMAVFPGVQSSPERTRELIREALDIYASFGITTIQDGGVPPGLVERMREEAAREPFQIDIAAFISVNNLPQDFVDGITVQNEYEAGFRLGGVKFMLDGSPQGRTAWLSQPYDQGPPGESADYRAYPSYEPEMYKSRIVGLLERGVPILAHANGDAAIDLMIDGVAEALAGKAMPDHRSVTIHAQLMRPDQLLRVQELGIVPSYYAAHPYFWGDWHRLSFGEERASFISPLQATLDLEIPFTIHNDSPVVPPDMMRLLWVAVNRETRSGHILGPDQRLSAYDALYSVTQAAAYQAFEEDEKGSITPGKRADLVILDRNPLTIDPADLADVQIVETLSRGVSVYP